MAHIKSNVTISRRIKLKDFSFWTLKGGGYTLQETRLKSDDWLKIENFNLVFSLLTPEVVCHHFCESQTLRMSSSM